MSIGYSDPDDLYTAICPQKINELCGKNIKTFAHSYFFILALTEEGEVYQKVYILECALMISEFLEKNFNLFER